MYISPIFFAVAILVAGCAAGPTPDQQRNRDHDPDPQWFGTEQRSATSTYTDPVTPCQNAMRLRPMSGSWGDALGLNARRAAIDLCLSDPQAHLKPLPWEQSAPVQSGPSPPRPCFVQPGGIVVCP